MEGREGRPAQGPANGDSIRIVITAHPYRILTAYNGAEVIQGFLHSPVTRRRCQ